MLGVLRRVLLPALVLAAIIASLLAGIGRYASSPNYKATETAYANPSGAVGNAGVANAVTGQAGFTG